MREINVQATNKVNIVGKLIEAQFREGTTKDGKPYESCNYTVRVHQTIEGKDEIHEIPLSMFASKYTNAGAPHPGYKNIQDMKKMKTIQEYGEAEASIVRSSSGSIQENYFVAKSGQLIDGWRINTSFVSEGGKGEMATFSTDIFIIDMHDEENRDQEPTGRLIIRGAIVQYGGKLDVVDFIVEAPDKVEYISRNWSVNDTVNVKGRVRFTVKETDVTPASKSSWGEDIPDIPTTQTVRELIVTSGSDEAFDEDFAYDPAEIKKAFNIRKANIEQAQVNATAPKKASASSDTKKKYSWE